MRGFSQACAPAHRPIRATSTAGDRVPLVIEVRNGSDDPFGGEVAVTAAAAARHRVPVL